MARALSGRDVGCPGCGYNLRDHTGSCCPRCQQRLRVAVTADEPYLAAWVTLLVSLWLSAWPGVVLWVATLVDRFALTHAGDAYELIAGGYAMMCLLLAVAVLLTRRAFCRLRRMVQWRFALPAALATAVVAVWTVGVIAADPWM